MNVSATLGAHSDPVALDSPKVYHIPQWGDFGDPKRMDVIHKIATMRGHDPRIATLAVKILKEAGVQPRDYRGQSAALLDFVQTKLYYVNEPGERLSDPLRTLKVGYGDCDDLVITLGALLTSINMPWKLVISGTKGRKKLRYHQGDKFPGGPKKGYNWSHIYLAIGDRPFTPTKWYYAETTVRGAPLGWDVVSGDASVLPEMNNFGAIMSYGNYHGGVLSQAAEKVGGFLEGSVLFSSPEYGLSPIVEDPSAPAETGAGSTMMMAVPGTVDTSVPTKDTPGYMVAAPPDLTGLTEAPSVAKGYDPGGRRRRRHRTGRGRGVRRAAPAGRARADMVAVVVIRPDGRVLALHRGAGVKWMPGKWDLPGGKTKGRTARKAAQALLRHEAGLKVKADRLRRCAAVYHPSAGTSVFYVLRLKAAEARKADIQIKRREHQGWRWVNRGTLLRDMKTAPYVGIAFRACFKPGSLDPYSHKMVEASVASSGDTGESVSLFVPEFVSPAFAAAAAPTVGTVSAPIMGLGAYGGPYDTMADFFGKTPTWVQWAAFIGVSATLVRCMAPKKKSSWDRFQREHKGRGMSAKESDSWFQRL